MGNDVSTKWRDNACPDPAVGVITSLGRRLGFDCVN